jgi:Flp pilus assembly protein TadB
MITPSLLAGALIGSGLLLAVRVAVDPPQPHLGRRLIELYEPPPSDGVELVRARWHAWALRALRFGGADLSGLRRDLAVCEVSMERHAAVKLGFAVGGAVIPAATSVLWAAAGITVPAGVVALAVAGGAIAGFLFPDMILARRAARRRRDFRYALSLFLELVVIVLAGGGGVHTALYDAAGSGSGWAFVELRRTLHTARLQRRSPWAALTDLAERIGSVELRELASSVELAGTSGARVRDSLRAKAISVRDHELAEAEAEALAASERMGAPMVGMFVGLILLIGYPAMVTVLAL